MGGVVFSSDSDLCGGDPTVCSVWMQGIMGALELGAPVRAPIAHQWRGRALQEVKTGLIYARRNAGRVLLGRNRPRSPCRPWGCGAALADLARAPRTQPESSSAVFGVKGLRVFQVGVPLSPSAGVIKLGSPPGGPEVAGSGRRHGSWQEAPRRRPPRERCLVSPHLPTLESHALPLGHEVESAVSNRGHRGASQFSTSRPPHARRGNTRGHSEDTRSLRHPAAETRLILC